MKKHLINPVGLKSITTKAQLAKIYGYKDNVGYFFSHFIYKDETLMETLKKALSKTQLENLKPKRTLPIKAVQIIIEYFGIPEETNTFLKSNSFIRK